MAGSLFWFWSLDSPHALPVGPGETLSQALPATLSNIRPPAHGCEATPCPNRFRLTLSNPNDQEAFVTRCDVVLPDSVTNVGLQFNDIPSASQTTHFGFLLTGSAAYPVPSGSGTTSYMASAVLRLHPMPSSLTGTCTGLSRYPTQPAS